MPVPAFSFSPMSATDSSRSHLLFSIIVPVYNRPDEVSDLLASLAAQSDQGFEAVIVEDGSTVPCADACRRYASSFRLQYFAKSNEGRSPARNFGMDHANGAYFIFVDSDCILPPDYIASLRDALEADYTPCFGGPDDAHASFSPLQKAINVSMTSLLTTGGIRGGKVSLEKFTPRTFNMGFSREVYEKVGGFREMFSEDIDMSTRIRRAGFGISLLRGVKVYHKRRISLRKFWRQVHVFGMSRITLKLLYPGSMKLVHTLPAIFTIGCALLTILSIFLHWWYILPLCVWLLAVWLDALISSRSLKVSLLTLLTSPIQLLGYGTGFLRAYTRAIILRQGRDQDTEIAMRRGK